MNFDLDERQLLQRGNTLKHGLITMSFLVLLDAFLKDNGIFIVEGVWSSILIVVLVSVLCIHENILRDVLNIEEKFSNLWVLFFGIGGVILLIWSIIDIASGFVSVMIDGQLTREGVSLVMAICWSSLLFTYFYKKTELKKTE